MTRKLLYIISKAPYSNAAGQEALEAIMIGASFEQEVSVLFLHDGVFQLKSDQHKNDVSKLNGELKEFTKTYRALADFGVDMLYCLDSSLTARGLSVDQLMLEPELVDEAAASQLISEQYRVFTF